MAGVSKPIRLLYITYNENVLESGILYSQVRQMLIEMAKRSNVKYIRLLSFISPRLWVRRRKDYSKLRLDLRNQGIDFRVRLMPAAQTWQWTAVPIFTICCLPVVLIHTLFGRFDIVHARGYGAGLLAFLNAKFHGIRFVFDPRGLFPEEMVLNKSWRAGGRTYRFWKTLEQHIIKECDAIIALTPRFKRDYLSLGARKVVFVPSRLDVESFASLGSKVKNYSNDLLFIGEMEADWNSPKSVAKHFTQLKKVIPNLKLRLITRKDPAFVLSIMEEEDVNRSDWSIESSKPEDMPARIVGSGIGLAMAFRPSGNWPMKYGEYLASGVPVVVEKEIGEHITQAVKRWKLGVVLEENRADCYAAVADVLKRREEYTSRCIRYARLKLVVSHSATQYARLYRQLLKD